MKEARLFCESGFQKISFKDLRIGDVLADTGAVTCLVGTHPVPLTGFGDFMFVCVTVFATDELAIGSADPARPQAAFAIIDDCDAERLVGARDQPGWTPPTPIDDPDHLLRKE